MVAKSLNGQASNYALRELKIEVTHRCSLNCLHCSSDSTPTVAREASPEDCLRILSEAQELGAQKVALSGGEPFLYKDLPRLVTHCATIGLNVSVYTSGNADSADQMLHEIAKHGIAKCVFSVFGSTASVHEQITRISGTFDATIRSVERSIALGLPTEFHFVPLSLNYQELASIAVLAKEVGVCGISVLRFVPQGRGALVRQKALDRNQNIALARAIRKLRRDGHHIRTGSPYNFLFLKQDPKCNSGKDRMIVGPDLRVFPCDAFKQIKQTEIAFTNHLSSLANASLRQVWEESPYLTAIRQYLRTPFELPCSRCEALHKCNSGCLAQKVIYYSKMRKAADPDCLMGHEEQQ